MFDELERDSAGAQEGQLYRRLLPQSPFDVRVELVVANRSRRFVVAGRSASPPASVAEMRGLFVAFDTGRSSLVVELLEPRLNQLFSALVADLTALLQAASAISDPVAIVLERLALWRRLFSDSVLEGLTLEQQRGLFCELLCLKEEFIPALGASRAVSSWLAPFGSARDFKIGPIAVEVKSRFRKGNTSVRISSEEQLASDDHSLFLLVYALDSGQGESLNQLVDACMMSLGDAPAVQLQFSDALVRWGYLDVHRMKYDQPLYTATVACFDVSEGFPRITPEDLRPGVLRVAYDVDLAACMQFSVAADSVREIIRAQVG